MQTYDDIIDGDENVKIKDNEILQFSDEHDLLWSIKLHWNSLYVKLPEQLAEGSKEKSVNHFYFF